MRHIFRFEIIDQEGIVYEYETDLEPFRLGEIINLMELTDDKRLDDVFVVREVWRNPITPQKEAILFTIERYMP